MIANISFFFSEGVNVIPNSTVEHVSFSDNQVHLRLNHGEEVSCFYFCFVVQFLKMKRNEGP